MKRLIPSILVVAFAAQVPNLAPIMRVDLASRVPAQESGVSQEAARLNLGLAESINRIPELRFLSLTASESGAKAYIGGSSAIALLAYVRNQVIDPSASQPPSYDLMDASSPVTT